MAYKVQRSNLEGVARGVKEGEVNHHLRREIESLRSRLAALEEHTGAVATGTKQGTPLAPAPTASQMRVTPKADSKAFVVSVTNPEFTSPRSTGNRSRAPLYHRLRYSPHADFSRDVVQFEPSTQTYFPVHEDPAKPLHFELQSSHDGVHWSQPRTVGPVSA